MTDKKEILAGIIIIPAKISFLLVIININKLK